MNRVSRNGFVQFMGYLGVLDSPFPETESNRQWILYQCTMPAKKNTTKNEQILCLTKVLGRQYICLHYRN